jgi:hypothetical protein
VDRVPARTSPFDPYNESQSIRGESDDPFENCRETAEVLSFPEPG